MTNKEELDVINKVLSGDKDAFEILVNCHQKNVYNLAFRILKNEQDAFDMSQESFIKAYMNLDKFQGTSKFSVWLYRLVSNTCIDFLRKSRKENLRRMSFENDDGTEQILDIPDVSSQPDTILEAKELRRELDICISLLPVDQREILTLREISGLSYSEIGQILDLSEGTVKSRLYRARVHIAKLLLKRGNIPPHFASKNKERRDVK